MLGLDPTLRAGPNCDRVLQRQALADRLPGVVRIRQTKGSDQQLREHAQMRNDSWFRLLIEDSRLVARGWVDPQAWQAQVKRARFGVFNGLANFDAAMMTECWLRTFESHPPGPPAELHELSVGESALGETAAP
jgi:hypothetical protein